MALTVATNTGALMAQAAASSVNKEMELSMERLATGKRINGASDDAAGVAIASRLSAEVRGTNQAIRNAMDAQAMVDTAEGAHSEIENILQRMRELAVQAANDTNATQDRTNLDAELDQLASEITRIANVTTWAGKNLMSASLTYEYQIGANTASGTDSVAVTYAKMTATQLSVNAAKMSVASAGAALVTINKIDAAIEAVNTQRAKFGAVSNRLDSTVNNLTNISSNLQAGLGRIEDADFAAETTTLAKAQILQQASTAMLAQANASKQNVLSLLQG